MVNHARQALKRTLLGSATIHQYRPIALRDPQSEVSVWLNGLGAARDVTCRNVAVSTHPLTFGIGLEKGLDLTMVKRARPSLTFRERQGDKRLLGEIGLRATESIPLEYGQLFLFEPHQCHNYCVGKLRLWTRYFYLAHKQRRSRKLALSSGIQIPTSHIHCLFVFYICPRPVILVSAADGGLANIVPMDLVGPVSSQCFSLALQTTSTAAPLIERSRRIALSGVPVEQAAVAYQLGRNHKAACADMDHLPFATTSSGVFGLPVPRFASRVTEMTIESVRTLGSYRHFLARAIHDRRLSDGQQFFLVHGFYERLAASGELSWAALGS